MSAPGTVGSSQIYEAGDQRTKKASDPTNKDTHPHGGERYEEGIANSHKTDDAKDQRSIANKLGHESKKDSLQDRSSGKAGQESQMSQQDSTKPVRMSSPVLRLRPSCHPR